MLSFESNTIALWRLPLDACSKHFARFKSYLSPKERVVLSQRSDPYRQRVFVLGHGLLHQALCAYTGHRVTLEHTAQGKWVVPNSPWYFNLSHAGDQLCLALTQAGSVGVDIEDTRKVRHWDALVKKYYHANEIEHYQQCSSYQKTLYAYQRWVCKEAWLKAHDLGVFGLACVQETDDDWCELIHDDPYCVALCVQTKGQLYIAHKTLEDVL